MALSTPIIETNSHTHLCVFDHEQFSWIFHEFVKVLSLLNVSTSRAYPITFMRRGWITIHHRNQMPYFLTPVTPLHG
jgi:hypothetical protein